MELHADLSQRALLNTRALAWLPSPMAGVDPRPRRQRAPAVLRQADPGQFSSHSIGPPASCTLAIM